MSTNPGGNSVTYLQGRLKREAPHLYARVFDGEISTRAAAIQAGFIKVKTPLEKIGDQLPKLDRDDVEWLAESLAAYVERLKQDDAGF